MELHGAAQTIIVLALAGALGLALGRITVGGVKLGIGGALFAGLALGHFGAGFDPTMLNFAKEFGLILFVYAIGIQVGPGFFAAFRANGLALNGLAIGIVLGGTGLAALLHLGLGLPLEAALGTLSGATTNTPSLAAAQQAMAASGQAANGTIGQAYALAYPFGIIGILLAMIAVRRAFRVDIETEAQDFERDRPGAFCAVETMNIEIRNPNLFGLTLGQIPGLSHMGVVLSRVMHDGTMAVAHPNAVIAPGDVVLALGPHDRLEEARTILGGISQIDLETLPTDLKAERLVVTNTKVLGRNLAALDLRRALGVSISRIDRNGMQFVPSSGLPLQFGDVLTAIGRPEDMDKAAALLGNSSAVLNEPQILPILIGIALGILLGTLPIALPGLPVPVTLGLAGGPLLVAIVLARLGHAGPLVWFLPPGAASALRELGIVLFLAAVGLASGAGFFETLIHGDGLLWMAGGALVTALPLFVAGFIGRRVLRLNYLTLCGVLAGSMTDPPALAFANQLKAGSEAAALGYATVYPLVMVLRVLAPQILVIGLI